MNAFSTVNPDQLPPASGMGATTWVCVFEPGGALQKLPADQFLSWRIGADLAYATKALLDADLAWAANSVALVFDDPFAAQNGWYRKLGAAAAGSWEQFEQLTLAIRQEVLDARDATVGAAAIAQAMANYRATFAEAVADFAVDDYFTCAETGSLRLYKRTAIAPYYADQGDNAAPVSKADVNPRAYQAASFAAIAALTVPANVTSLMTLSYAGTVGRGGGSYAEVTVGGAALLAAHPRFVTTSNGGTRYWQLVPGEFGLFPEQAGAIGGYAIDHAVNNQPAFQAVVDYGIVMGCLKALLKHPYYTLWCPLRTYADNNYQLDQSGIPVVIAGKHFTFESLCKLTNLYRRAPGGGDPNNWANWPLLSGGQGWRGGFFTLVKQAVAPALYSDRAGLTIDGIALWGGLPLGAEYGALNLATGDGWDVTDKPINTMGDGVVGDVRIINSIIDGFRGELVYGTARTDATLFIRDSAFGNSNGQGINPNSCKLDAKGVYIYSCAFGVEGWGGARGRLQGVIDDCVSAGGIQGGRGTAGTFSAFNNPTRVDADTPTLHLDLEVRKSGTFYPGAWTGGRLRAIDGRISFSQSIYADGLWDTHFEQIEIVTDTINGAGVDFSGGNGTTSALQGIQDVKLDRISYSRTKDARAAARLPTTPFTWTNSLGQGIVIGEAHGELGAPPVYTGTPADFAPAFLRTNFTQIPGFGAASQNIQTTPTLTWRGPYVGITTTGTGVYGMNLPTGSRNKGERLTLHGIGPGTARINGDPTSGSGLRSNNQTLFLLPNLRLTLEWDGSYWFPVDGAITEMTFSLAAYDAPNLVTLTRDTLTFTVTGVALGDKIKSISFGIDTGGVEVGMPYVSAADTVSVKRYNPTGADIDWAATTVRINWTKAT